MTAEVELPHIYSGKVRDIYDDGERRLFCHLRPDVGVRRGHGRADPRQGPGAHGPDGVLVDAAGRRGPHAPGLRRAGRPGRRARQDRPRLAGPGRWWCRRAEMLPIECIVRGYLSGSAWAEYRTLRDHARQALPAGLRAVRAAARAGVHPVDQGDRRATTRTSPSSRRPTWSAPSWPPAAREICLEAYRAGRGPGRRARDHHRRHQVRARAHRRRAGHLRRGAHAGLVPVLAGRPVAAGRRRRRRSTSSRCGTGSRRPAGTRRRRRPPLPAEVVRPRGSATWRPTSG